MTMSENLKKYDVFLGKGREPYILKRTDQKIADSVYKLIRLNQDVLVDGVLWIFSGKLNEIIANPWHKTKAPHICGAFRFFKSYLSDNSSLKCSNRLLIKSSRFL